MPRYDYQQTFDGDFVPVQEYTVSQLLAATDESLPSRERVRQAWMLHPAVHGFIEFVMPAVATATESREAYARHITEIQTFESFCRQARKGLHACEADSCDETPVRNRRTPRWYTEYLATEYWTRMRSAVADYYKNCVVCSIDCDVFDAHHKHYDTVGNERIWDVSLLCKSCHAKVHGWLDVCVPSDAPDAALKRIADEKRPAATEAAQ